MANMRQIYYNATQDMVVDVAEEVPDTVVWHAVISLLIALFSALGLGKVAAYLKNR